MNRRIQRLPVVPLAVPVQLVLGLDGVGIRKPRKRRKQSVWAPMPTGKVAA